MRTEGSVNQAKFGVRGMDCADCVRTVQSAASKVTGIRDCQVLLNAERLTVTFEDDADRATVEQELSDRIRSAGYTLTSGNGVDQDARNAGAAAADARNAADSSEASEGASAAQGDSEHSQARSSRRAFGSGSLLGAFAAVVTGIGLFVVLGEWFGLIDMLVGEIPAWGAVPVVVAAGWPRIASVLRALRNGRIISHTLMTTAMVAALIVGEWATALVLVLFMHVGAYAEQLVAEKSRNALRALAARAPRTARVVNYEGAEQERPAESVAAGELVRVSAGEMIPVDGVVVSGNGAVSQAAITGESLPLDAGEGDELYAAGKVIEGGLTLRTLRSGGGSVFGRIVELVSEAESARGPTARVADRFSGWYLPVVLTIALATYLIGGEILPAVAVLAVACSCSFALATPIAMLASIASAARDGLLIRSGEVIERSRGVDVVMFDKTGTLTVGEMTLEDVVCSGAVERDEALRLAASAEAYSEHPLATAVRSAATAAGVRPEEPGGFSSKPGGVSATVDGRSVRVGGRRYLGLERNEAEQILSGGAGTDESATDRSENAGSRSVERKSNAAVTPAFLEVDGTVVAAFLFADPLRAEARQAVEELRAAGISHIEMITGDEYDRASGIASELGIELRAGLLPDEKLARIAELQDSGRSVMMVGDGINDAPALARADVGVALGRLEAAVDAAPVVLLRSDLLLVPQYLERVGATMRIVFGNIGFTSVYNVVGITLAAIGILPPVLAAALQSAPDVGVLANSSRLARRRGGPVGAPTAEPVGKAPAK